MSVSPEQYSFSVQRPHCLNFQTPPSEHQTEVWPAALWVGCSHWDSMWLSNKKPSGDVGVLFKGEYQDGSMRLLGRVHSMRARSDGVLAGFHFSESKSSLIIAVHKGAGASGF